jgi:thymidylate synthase (FAD)
MGIDETVVAAARHSYDKGLDLDDVEGNERLINFLMRERHTSPFEQPALVFEVKAPIFVFREWHRHRTAKLNEMSGRYTELQPEWYIPEQSRIQRQSKSNKQGSGQAVPVGVANEFITESMLRNMATFSDYRDWVDEGIAKEVARIDLPLSTYSKMVWQMDLHNLLHFLKLRMDEKAQWEIRQFAYIIGGIVSTTYPKVWKAFLEYEFNAVRLSATEKSQLAGLLKHSILPKEYDGLLRKLGVKPEGLAA